MIFSVMSLSHGFKEFLEGDNCQVSATLVTMLIAAPETATKAISLSNYINTK